MLWKVFAILVVASSAYYIFDVFTTTDPLELMPVIWILMLPLSALATVGYAFDLRLPWHWIWVPFAWIFGVWSIVSTVIGVWDIVVLLPMIGPASTQIGFAFAGLALPLLYYVWWLPVWRYAQRQSRGHVLPPPVDSDDVIPRE